MIDFITIKNNYALLFYFHIFKILSNRFRKFKENIPFFHNTTVKVGLLKFSRNSEGVKPTATYRK